MARSSLFLLLLLLLTVLSFAEAQRKESNITIGSSLSLTSNSSWLSTSGLFAFGFYKQQNGFSVGIFIAGIPQKTVIWTVNRNDPPVSGNVTLLFSSDGRLQLRSAQGQVSFLVIPPKSASSASILNSGNFVFYDSNAEIIWQSFSTPTDTLVSGQFLSTGSELVSSVSNSDQATGIFCLIMQQDGNLVQYPTESPQGSFYSYWSTATVGAGINLTLHLEDDGSLFMLSSNGTNVHNISNGGHPTSNMIYLLRIDPDGILRIYSINLNQNGNQSVIWQSTNNGCDPKGLCGLNGFCVLNDVQASCVCLPGFAPVLQGNWSSGCERNFTAETCKSTHGSSDYSIQLAVNSVFEDVYYSSIVVSTRDDCEKACLEDCNCDAASFKDTTCKKMRLPLKYGKRDLGDSTAVLVKVGNPISTATVTNATVVVGTEKKVVRKDIFGISIAVAAFGLLMASIAGLLICKTRRRPLYRRVDGEAGLSEIVSPQSFTYLELENMTNGFKNEIGRGAFGPVYKGRTLDGLKEVAVKTLYEISEQGEKEFKNEVAVIGKTHHRNLVRLLGYCIEGHHRLLVYQYMSKGCLADTIFSSENRYSWVERIEIAKNIARGILYLHEECETQIIHCDIKPQNVLIDDHQCPKISDFGLAKLLNPDQTKTFTGIRGTRGYVAPEWHRRLPITAKADVFSYGIMLLEIIALRPNVDFSRSEDEALLEQWANKCYENGETRKLVGEEEVDSIKLERMVKLALWCIQDEPSLRPSMRKVLLMLEGLVEIPAPPSPTSFLSSL